MSRKHNTTHPDRNKFRKYSFSNKLEGRKVKENEAQKKIYKAGGTNQNYA